MSDSPVNCCLCLRDIEKSYERLILERCSKDFDILAEIESLELSPLDSKYICRQCVAKPQAAQTRCMWSSFKNRKG